MGPVILTVHSSSVLQKCLTDMLGYMCQITRAGQRFKCLSWVIFDQNFRQEAADRDIKVWSQGESGRGRRAERLRTGTILFAQCFTGRRAWSHGAKHATHLTTALTCALSTPPVNKRQIQHIPISTPGNMQAL